MRARWLAAAALCAAVGCGEEDNPLFCDATHPCTGADRPFCDIAGAYPESGGVRNTCIAMPFDAGGGQTPDAGIDGSIIGGPDAAPVDAPPIDAEPIDAAWCGGDLECTDEPSPICDTGNGMCRGCVSPGECATRDPGRPLCAPDGRCVACLDSTDDCTAPTEPICDVGDGMCRACAGGAAGDAECDGRSVTTPYCAPDGACAECLLSLHCPAGEPICDPTGRTCRGCAAGGGGDGECAARDAALARCRGGDGLCVECLGDADCDLPTAPVCETAPGSCRACRADSECASAICDEPTGACVSAGDIVYVAKTGADGAACGTQAAPCLTIGGATGGLVKVGGTRRFVHVAAGSYVESVTADAVTATVVGASGANVFPPAGGNNPGFRVRNGADLTIERVTIANATGGSNADGIHCDTDSAIHLIAVAISSNADKGIDSSTCALTVERSRISGNLGGGIVTSEGDFSIVNNFMVDNGHAGAGGSLFGGASISNSGAAATQVFAFNTVAGNQTAPGAFASGVICSVVTPMTATSDIVYDGIGGMASVAGPCSWSYSDIEAAAPVAGTGNLAVGPSFLDPTTGDYHLDSDSPCRGAGNPVGGSSVDFDGDARPNPAGGAPDMGADEVP